MKEEKVDGVTRLAMNTFSNKGVYALLLGSGVSLEAKIMSGWKVTEDLIKRIAIVQGEDIPIDAFAWYKQKFGCVADYSNLLEQLGKKPSELESLLRPYFEPSEEDKEQGYKKPTVAHKAIAKMAKRGYFKLIITTNFDQLMETALNELNVKYQTICHESEIEGKVPLYHYPLTLLKINGDYKDCRFRNTEKELSKYPKELVGYLKPALKNFGMITCGWSAIWDIALVRLISTEKKHRYSYYFTYVGDSADKLGVLSRKCGGELLKINGADDFFKEMNEKLMALEAINEKNMEIDAQIAVARVKEYIPDQKRIIKYSDLYERMTEKVITDMKSHVYGDQYPSASLFEKTIADMLQILSVILPASIEAIKWAKEEHYGPIEESLYRIANRKFVKPGNAYMNTTPLNYAVDTIYMYGLGVACVYYKKYGLLDRLFRVKLDEADDYYTPYIIDRDNCWIMDKQSWQTTMGNMDMRTPFSSTLMNDMRSFFGRISSEIEYEAVFCIFEKLLAMYYYMLITRVTSHDPWPPIGTFVVLPIYFDRRRNTTYADFFNDVLKQKSNSDVIKSGMFEGQFDVYKEALDKVNEVEALAYGKG